MGQTLAEKILAAHAGKTGVQPGEMVDVGLDLIVGNDASTPIAVKQIETYGLLDKVKHPEKIHLALSHYSPAKDINTAHHIQLTKKFADRYPEITLFPEGYGIEHVIIPEEGLVGPGDLVIGADSHTCTYGALGAFSTGVGSTDLAASMVTGRTWMKVPETQKFVYTGKRRPFVTGKDLILYVIRQIGVDGAMYQVMEHAGEALRDFTMEERLTIANMAIEAGAKTGIVVPDEVTERYLHGRAKRNFRPVHSDADAVFAAIHEWDISNLEPQVAKPNLPSNTVPVSEVEGLSMDQVYIGSCTNGRISDLRIAAEVFKGRKANSNLRAIVVPGSKAVYQQALKEGLIDIFMEAGCLVGPPTCGACFGGSMGILAPGDRCLSTTNRNFTGRMGAASSEVYLANPAVAAATAVAGKITHPAELANEAATV
jgi:3-isopropylmalate/(R)-2-methylmalate dehydratase large subunit